MSSDRHATGWLFFASLASILVLAVCAAGFLFPGRYEDEAGFPPTKFPESRWQITASQAKKISEIQAHHLALIKAHLATLEGASALSEKLTEQTNERIFTYTVEFQQNLNRIFLTGEFEVYKDSLVILPSYDLRVTSPHYFISVQATAGRMQQWIHELVRLVEAWDSAIEQSLVKKADDAEP